MVVVVSNRIPVKKGHEEEFERRWKTESGASLTVQDSFGPRSYDQSKARVTSWSRTGSQ